MHIRISYTLSYDYMLHYTVLAAHGKPSLTNTNEEAYDFQAILHDSLGNAEHV